MTPALYTEIDLGTARVGITGPTDVLPTFPERDPRGTVWPTSKLAMRSKVKMTDGSTWRVKPAPRRTPEGDIVITLTSPTRAQISICVPRHLLEEPLWWTGDPVPSDEVPMISGRGEQTDPVPAPPANTPETPVEPSPGNSGNTPGGGNTVRSRANSVR